MPDLKVRKIHEHGGVNMGEKYDFETPMMCTGVG